ncbi:MAG: ImmA/IrrE family metallo-endopeptidase, partial [Nitrosopumilus sp.]
EKGLINIPDETIKTIAKALDFPIQFFHQNLDIRINPIYYRKRASIPKKELYKSEALRKILLKNIDRLLESVDIPDFTLPPFEVTKNFTPEDAAQRIRYIMDIPSGPITKPIHYLERNGIIVQFADLGSEKFDGITQFTEKQQPIIFVNKKHSNDRKRFTLGHELGHLVLHLMNKETLEKDDKEIESEANRFSAEFNIPELECKTDLRNLKYKDLGHLKQYWKMSKQAIAYRAKELRTISHKTYEYYMIELSRSGERKKEIGDVPIDTPRLFNDVINMHREKLGYSIQDMINILNLSMIDYKRYFESSNHLRIVYD